MTDTLTVESSESSQQMVVIQPETVTPPARKIPVEAFVNQTTARIAVLQSQIDNLQAQLDSLTSQKVDVTAIQQKVSSVKKV